MSLSGFLSIAFCEFWRASPRAFPGLWGFNPPKVPTPPHAHELREQSQQLTMSDMLPISSDHTFLFLVAWGYIEPLDPEQKKQKTLVILREQNPM